MFFHKIFCALVCASLLLCVASGATISLTNGQTIRGEIISQNEQQVLVRLEYGTMSLARSRITSVDGKILNPISVPKETHQRVPNWRSIISSVANQSWGKNLQQIPATVIDKGVLRSVPYISFRISEDYELNIYGDLDSPACVELGVCRGLLKDEAAKTNCLSFIGSVLGKNDKQVLAVLDRKQDLKVASGLTFEITPETAEDAYGGWWISVYDTKKLDAARATQEELALITTTAQKTNDWTREDISYARKLPRGEVRSVDPAPYSPSSLPDPIPVPIPYASGRMRFSPTPTPIPTPDYFTGTVYVRGYYRKNGTYVQGYTRHR